jgi:polyphosphate kinase 2 (PPK2 family)
MSLLDQADLSLTLDRDEYKRRLAPLQVELRKLAYELYERRRSMVIVYEGWDAAGKGGNIRRVTEKMDPRGYHVWQIAAPAGEDATHQYLWRFWRRLLPPDEKQILIFDRSWYGRVLVERVEGFATSAEWKRAYREINDFERQLGDAGWLVAKFWVHISKKEQLQRFESREATPHKKWKLTQEDWRNRDKWEAYSEAVQDMVQKTSTFRAPWTIVEGNCKRWARVRTVAYLVEMLRTELGIAAPEPLPTSAPDEDAQQAGPGDSSDPAQS